MKYNNALLYKWLIGNSFAFLVVYVAWLQGWIQLAYHADASFISWAMSALFGFFWLLSSYRVFTINREMSLFMDNRPMGVAAEYFESLRRKSHNQGGGPVDQSMLASTLRARMLLQVQIFNYVSNLMVLMALIGTVLGFVIATYGLGDLILQGEGAERLKSVLGQIVNGLGVAPFTTLVGSILGGVWLGVHHQLLMRAASALVVGIVEKAEIEVIPRLATGVETAPILRPERPELAAVGAVAEAAEQA
jgi:hypothetical protein